MRILYVGPGAVGSNSTSMARGFAALGHDVLAVWTDAVSKPTRFGPAWTYKRATGRRAPWTIRTVTDQLRQARDFRPDMLFCFKTVQLPQEELLSVNARVKVHYSPDDVSDPYFTSPAYLKSEHLWDLIVTTKDYCAPEIKARGAKEVLRVWSGYDPAWHFRQPRTVTPQHEVGFIGSALARPGRIELLHELSEIYGPKMLVAGEGWKRTSALDKATILPAVYGQAFAETIARIRSNIIMLNGRDVHTTRSYEVPACGGLFVGERTTEHSQMYDEDKEAFFFSSLPELTEKLTMISADHELARSVALRGWQRVTGTPNTYADRAREIVAAVDA